MGFIIQDCAVLMQCLVNQILFWYVLWQLDTQLKSNQEAIATHGSSWSKLTASLLSASSLCHTRLVRSLGNLHVVAGDRDPVCCEPCGSHRDTASATANTGALINLNVARVHLQASSLRPTLSHMETWAAFAHNYWCSVFCEEMFSIYVQTRKVIQWFLLSFGSHSMVRSVKTSFHWCLCKSSQTPEAQHSLSPS